MNYNSERMARLEIELSIANASARAASAAALDATDEARAALHAANSAGPLPWRNRSPAELLADLQIERHRVLGQPDHLFVVDRSIALARTASVARARAEAMRAEADRMAAAVVPLRTLVNRCKEFIVQSGAQAA